MTFDNLGGLPSPPEPPPSWDRNQFHQNVTAPVTLAARRQRAKESGPRELPFTSVAFVSAVVLLLAQALAISLAIQGNLTAATVLAQLLNWLTIVPFTLGVVALVRGPYRGWAIAAMMVAVIATPFLLRSVLSFFGGL